MNTSSTTGTSVEAEWEFGIPFVKVASAPVLKFVELSTGHVFYAIVATALMKDKVISKIVAPDCSFAGGCYYSIQSSGLAEILNRDKKKNYLSVCNSVCEFSKNHSSASEMKCKVPAMPTVFSNREYGI